jgi:CspA family cold shock protein
MELGTINKKILDRGFGFITASDGNEVFFHKSECQSLTFDSLSEGQEVAFDRESNAKGPRARNIRANVSV